MSEPLTQPCSYLDGRERLAGWLFVGRSHSRSVLLLSHPNRVVSSANAEKQTGMLRLKVLTPSDIFFGEKNSTHAPVNIERLVFKGAKAKERELPEALRIG